MKRDFRGPDRPRYQDFSEADRPRFDRPPPPRRPPRPEPSPRRSAAPIGAETWHRPWVQMKYFSYNPGVFPRMIGAASPDAAAGNLVAVYDRQGELFGQGFFNPDARIPLRVLSHGAEAPSEDSLDAAIRTAVAMRRDFLKVDATTDAWRAVHSDADLLGGLIVDKFADVLSIEVSNLGAWQRLGRWLPLLHAELGTVRAVVHMDEDVARYEGVDLRTAPELPVVETVKIRENGIRYAVDFTSGHKTGFFCDQRDNRRQLAQWTEGRRVLDLCCYTGGFSLSAKVTGKAADVTGVDLDERAIDLAKVNGNLNQTRVKWVHADAFDYARQMLANQEKFGVVVLDPPKFVTHRDDYEIARRKYNDLNALALSLVEPGGLFVTCSCSGLLEGDAFEQLVIAAAHRHGRKLQIIDQTGAGPDHPVMSHCLDSRYLKVLWALVH